MDAFNEAMKLINKAIDKEKAKQELYKREFMTEEQLIEEAKTSTEPITNLSEIL